ncbi:hypothetical protein [Streptomyces goshikiensis]|uniref:hypothetical protein n=1 Tax=Streptomyces goshikiensis TaxID=1942 RepID=UPI003677A891
MPLPRAPRATVETPRGPVTVYVAHLPSVRVRAAGSTAGGPVRTSSATRDDAAAPLLGGNGLRPAQKAAAARARVQLAGRGSGGGLVPFLSGSPGARGRLRVTVG